MRVHRESYTKTKLTYSVTKSAGFPEVRIKLFGGLAAYSEKIMQKCSYGLFFLIGMVLRRGIQAPGLNVQDQRGIGMGRGDDLEDPELFLRACARRSGGARKRAWPPYRSMYTS